MFAAVWGSACAAPRDATGGAVGSGTGARIEAQRPVSGDTRPSVPLLARPGVARVISHGPRTLRQIALTFDACATRRPSGYDGRVVEVLVELHVPATFFLGGKWMLDHPDQTRYLASIPQFELANHSFLHPHMTRVSDERLRRELQQPRDVLFALTGRRPTLFRAPFGEYDARVVAAAARLGMTTIQYDLASGDPDASISEQRLIERVTREARNGSIIVMHVNRRGWHTAEALPEIVRRLRERGFSFVTVSELLTAPEVRTAAARRR